jgi:dolichol-phosphate mannosyltransferase
MNRPPGSRGMNPAPLAVPLKSVEMHGKLKLSIVIPAHNEVENLPRTVKALDEALSRENVPFEILVVNDHSTDGTEPVLAALAKRYAALRWIENDHPNGFGYAVRKGLESFSGDAVCIVMADASDDPEDVVTYYRELEKGSDCVFGSRFMEGGRVHNYPAHKLVVNRLANTFIRLLFGLRYDDVTNAFKCYRREVVEHIHPILSCHFNLTVELPLKAIVRGFSYSVVPINWYGRVSGISKLRIREMGSRYLFIVFYVFLEKWLSRSHYRAPDASLHRPVRDDESGPEGMARGRDTAGIGLRAWARANTLKLVLTVLVLVRVGFIVTYPLNDMGGDTPNYWTMMTSGKSNLVHAGGYPLLMGAIFRTGIGKELIDSHPLRARYLLLAGQHAIDLCFVFLLFRVVEGIYGRLAAAVSSLILGLDLQGMGATSSVYPEWLQACLLIGALSAAYFGFRASGWRRKTLCYSVSSVLFTWCVLVKFNAAFVAVVYLALFLADRTPVRRRIVGALLAVTAAGVTCTGYLLLYHYPSTGTFHLTHDRSWVLAAKLNAVLKGRLPPSNGVFTKRWLALSSVLPQNFMEVAGAGMFSHVDAVPKEVREPYRERYLSILTADEPWLAAFLGSHELPSNFSLNLSSVPISYFIGLRESDDVGVGMFWEAVRSQPRLFLGQAARDTLKALYRGPDYHYPLSPTTKNMKSLGIKPATNEERGFVPLQQPADPWHWPFSYSHAVVWWPGLKFFSRMPDHVLPPLVAALASVLALAVAVLRAVRQKGVDPKSGLPLVLAGLGGLLVAASCVILEFRWKEARLVLPLTSTLTGIGLSWGIRETWRALFELEANPRTQSSQNA